MIVKKIAYLMVLLAAALLVGCAGEPQKTIEEPSDLVWPPPPETPRIRYLKSYYGQVNFTQSSDLKSSLLGLDASGIVLEKPSSVAVNADGSRMYVTDTKVAEVIVFDFNLSKVYQLRRDAMSGGGAPIDVAVDSRERIYFSTGYAGGLYVVSKEGKTLLSLGKEEGLTRPTGLALDELHNRLYVADTINHRILIYNLEGRFIGALGERGTDPGQFNYPVYLATDREGQLYVVDTGNFRVQIFSSEGEFIRGFGQAGDAWGDFSRPKGIGVDSEGHIYVLDGAFNNLQIFDGEGHLLLFLGQLGRDPGMFWLPVGLYVDAADRVYVADSINNRVQVFQYIPEEQGAKEGKTVP